MKKFLLVAALATIAVAANAQVFRSVGSFNGWDEDDDNMIMTDLGAGHFQKTITGLTAGSAHEFKITTDGNWSNPNYPGNNVRVKADSAGNLTVNFFNNTTWTDGWQPASSVRVGYADHQQHDWEVMGSFNGFASGLAMTDLGNGVHQLTSLFSAGNVEIKFRSVGDWFYNHGAEFGDNSANINFTSDGVLASVITLDLPNGRYKVEAVPEPATMTVLAGLAGLAALRRRNRKS